MIVVEIFGRRTARRDLVLPVAFVLFFVLGGGSRDDILSLLILRPLSIAVLGYAALVATAAEWRIHKAALAGILFLVALHFAQLLPLPPDLWASLPGREQAVENLRAADFPLGWRPISLVPFQTWNSLFALAAPVSIWLLAISALDRRRHSRLVAVVAGLALLSALLGLLQVASGYDSGLYFYRITSNAFGVGLFANRNHNGFFLATALPMIGYIVGEAQRAGMKPIAAFAALGVCTTVLFLGVLFAGSRGGLILFAIGMAATLFMVELPKFARAKVLPRGAVLIALGVAAVSIAVFVNPSNTFSRFSEVNSTDELRFEIWPIAWAQIWTFFPWGAGMGTFVENYQLAETSDLLRPTYINHAHNDWIEILMDAGVGGMVLLLGGALLWIQGLWRVLGGKVTGRLPLLGLVVIAMLALGSFLDYPLRTPALASLFALAAAWTAVGSGGEARQMRSSDKKLVES